MNKSKLLGPCRNLVLCTVLLCLVNIVAVYTQNVQLVRAVGISSALVFLIFYWMRATTKNALIFMILLTVLLREFSLIFYETKSGHILYLILGIAAYGLVCLERIDILKTIKNDKGAIIYIALFVAFNIYALQHVIAIIEGSYDGYFAPILVYIFGLFTTIIVATAIMYNQIYNSNRSLAFVFFVLCFVISDVTSLFAYYFDYTFLFYIDAVTFVLGLGFLSFTVLEIANQEEEEEQYSLLS